MSDFKKQFEKTKIFAFIFPQNWKRVLEIIKLNIYIYYLLVENVAKRS